MDAIQHIIGICHDGHLHLDLIDILALGGLGSAGVYIKYRFQEIKESVKSFFNGDES